MTDDNAKENGAGRNKRRATIVGIDADTDEKTIPGCKYRNRYVYPLFRAKGFDVQTLQNKNATKTSIDPVILNPAVKYITGSGHGTAEGFKGWLNDEVFGTDNHDTASITGRIIHLTSCKTALKLGLRFAVEKCLAFFGYDRLFISGPPDCELYYGHDSIIDQKFAEGLTAKEVFESTTRAYRQTIDKLRESGEEEKDQMAANLETNLESLRCPSALGKTIIVPDAFGYDTASLL